MLKLLGCLFYLVGIADFAGMFFGYDFTGQSWTPILFCVIGQFFISLGGKGNPAQGEDEE